MRKKTRNMYLARMNTVLLHIQSHLDSELSLEELAALSCFSPTHFHRIFKGMMGETVADHIRRIRLERAALRLVGGRHTVTGAAFDAGYETVESFSRAFKKMFGCPPSRYREQHWRSMYDKFPGLVHYRPNAACTKLYPKDRKETNMEVRIQTVPPMQVAFIRKTGPYNQCEQAWERLCAWAGPKGLLRADTQYLGVGHDDPQVTPPDKIRYDACVTVDENVEGEGEVGIQTVGDGRYAVTTHEGPYEDLEATYAELMGRWLPESGERLGSGLCFELYRNDPKSTPPEALLTDIYISIE